MSCVVGFTRPFLKILCIFVNPIYRGDDLHFGGLLSHSYGDVVSFQMMRW